MNSIDSLKWRYAVKKFDETKLLSNEKINLLKKAFNLTPTSYGLQPVKLVIIKNKELQKKLVQHSWNQEQIAQASHLFVICVPKKFTTKAVEDYFNLVKEIRNTPDEILNPFKDFLIDEVAKKSQEELFQWNKNQAYITLGNLLTVCAIEKIDACPIEGFSSEEYNKILNLDAHNLQSVLVLPVGFRANDCYMKDLEKVRKKTTDIVIEIS
ncbi:NAD(P)H-dependent oxidoreductase [Tenacibaculum sp. UWU-22]|uniref:NAD(P)H-dependent oxidoreductase n=1 Tax=Tenacibaculum sp. UWU-22 TaxID=3234187 RepID=UPI0034DADB14